MAGPPPGKASLALAAGLDQYHLFTFWVVLMFLGARSRICWELSQVLSYNQHYFRLARSGSVASQQVLSSILIRSEFPAVGVKKPSRCARREAWPSRAGFRSFLYPDKPVWLPLNEKTVGPFPPPSRVFFSWLRSEIAVSRSVTCFWWI